MAGSGDFLGATRSTQRRRNGPVGRAFFAVGVLVGVGVGVLVDVAVGVLGTVKKNIYGDNFRILADRGRGIKKLQPGQKRSSYLDSAPSK